MRVIYSHSPEHCLVPVHCGSILSHYCRILFKKNNKAEFQFFWLLRSWPFFPPSSLLSPARTWRLRRQQNTCPVAFSALHPLSSWKCREWFWLSRAHGMAAAGVQLLQMQCGFCWGFALLCRLCQSIVLKPVWGVHSVVLQAICSLSGKFLAVSRTYWNPSRFSCLIFGVVQMKHVKLAAFEGITHCVLMTETAIVWANPNQREKYNWVLILCTK